MSAIGGFVGLNDAALGLRKLPKTLADIEISAVNRVAKRSVKAVIEEITGNVNLSPEYVKRHIYLASKAKKGKMEAVIRSNYRPILLRNYGMVQLFGPVKRPKTAKGDARRNIRPGIKNIGATVQVKSSARGGTPQYIKGAFMVPLKAGTSAEGNGWGLAVRDKGKQIGYRVMHGPSLHSAWNFAREKVAEDIGQQVMETFAEILARQLTGI